METVADFEHISAPIQSSPDNGFDLSSLPAFFVLPTHLNPSTQEQVKQKLVSYKATLANEISNASIVLAAIGTRRRAVLELRSRHVEATEIGPSKESSSPSRTDDGPRRKRRRHETSLSVTEEEVTTTGSGSDSFTLGDSDGDQLMGPINGSPIERPAKRRRNDNNAGQPESRHSSGRPRRKLQVVKLDWLNQSEKSGEPLPLDDFLVLEGYTQEDAMCRAQLQHSKQSEAVIPYKNSMTLESACSRTSRTGEDILTRAKADPIETSSRYGTVRRRFRPGRHDIPSRTREAPPKLVQHSTSDFEGSDNELPEPPEWVKRGYKYSCQRKTTQNFANAEFVAELSKIKLGRLLTLDEIGVRAYSTSIAAIAAYPHVIKSAKEILRLPGCDTKIANLWIEWKHSGYVQAAKDVEYDETLQGIRIFYEIWGVGPTTARDFYLKRGWRDMDDAIEYGWKSLSRVQQIGLKFYDDFQQRISRPEVESIAATIHEHARRVRDDAVECLIVGGYRRGKENCGDVDVLLSHRTLGATKDLVVDVVKSLETAGHITHTLTLALTNTKRDQMVLPMRSADNIGSGFDTLDKAMVVWQDPTWPSREEDIARDPAAKNPAPHRRVDIIITPWRTVGCAIVGWSGDTTFERDLRRYVKHVHNWKFDSSGIRSRKDGTVVYLEGPEGVQGGLEEAERRVFEGMGLEYIEPDERWTG